MILPFVQLLTFTAVGLLIYLLVRLLGPNEPKCSALPCLNQGNCTDLENGDFLCECPLGISGRICEGKMVNTKFISLINLHEFVLLQLHQAIEHEI